MHNNISHQVSEDLFDLLYVLHKRLMNPEQAVKNMAMPPSHAKVIFYLAHVSQDVSVSHLAKTLSISKPNMTPIIDKLIQDSFVERYTDPSDRRIIRIKLTEKAIQLFKKHKICMINLLDEKISKLPESELTNLKFHVEEVNKIVLSLE